MRLPNSVKITFCVVLTLLTLLTGSSAFAQQQKPDWIYYLVDRSSSMGSGLFGLEGNELVEPVTAQIIADVNKLPKNTRVTLQFFSSSADSPQSWFPLDDLNRKHFEQYFKDQFRPHGATRLYDSVDEALLRLHANASDYNRVILIIFSDGEDTASKKSSKREGWAGLSAGVANLTRENPFSRVILIALGYEPSAADKNALDKIGVTLDTYVDQPEKFTIKTVPPAPAISVIPRKAAPGEPLTFTASNWGGAAETYRWAFGDGNSTEGIRVTHAYRQEGVYTVSLTVVGPGGSATETKENLVEISRNIPLKASFSIQPEKPREGQTILLRDESTGSPQQREWQINGRTVSRDAAYQWTTTQSGDWKITLLIQRDGKTDTATKQITIKPPPPSAKFTVVGGDRFNFGDTVTMEANDTRPGLTHQWTIGGTTQLEGVRVQWKAELADLVTIIHRVRDNSGAVAIADDKIQITKPTVPLPRTDFKVSPLNARVNEPITLSILQPEPDVRYRFSIDGQPVGEGESVVYTPKEAGTVLLEVTATKGNLSNSREGDLRIGEQDLAIVNFKARPTKGSFPLTVEFTDQSEGRIAAYLWDFGDGNTSTDANPIHTYSEVGSYSVTLVVTNAAGKQTTSPSPLVIDVNEPMPVEIKIILWGLAAIALWLVLVSLVLTRLFGLTALQKPAAMLSPTGGITLPLHRLAAVRKLAGMFWPITAITIGKGSKTDICITESLAPSGTVFAKIRRVAFTNSYELIPLAKDKIYRIDEMADITTGQTKIEKCVVNTPLRLPSNNLLLEIDGQSYEWTVS